MSTVWSIFRRFGIGVLAIAFVVAGAGCIVLGGMLLQAAMATIIGSWILLGVLTAGVLYVVGWGLDVIFSDLR